MVELAEQFYGVNCVVNSIPQMHSAIPSQTKGGCMERDSTGKITPDQLMAMMAKGLVQASDKGTLIRKLILANNGTFDLP